MDSRQILISFVITLILIISEFDRGVKAEDTTTDMPSTTQMTTKKPMMPMKLGDKCDTHEECMKKMENSECKNNKCSCKGGFKEDSKKMNCMPSSGIQMFASMSCLLLAMMAKIIV